MESSITLTAISATPTTVKSATGTTTSAVTWSDATTTYVANWSDVNGNGTVDSADTVTVTTTPNAVVKELKAEVELSVSTTTPATDSTTDTTLKNIGKKF